MINTDTRGFSRNALRIKPPNTQWRFGFEQAELPFLSGRCLWTQDVWPVGCAHCQRRVRAASCSPAPLQRPESPSSQAENPAVTQRDPRSAGVRLCEARRPDKYETKAPLDVGGPPVINRSATPLSTPPAKKKKMRDPKDNTDSWHMWAIFMTKILEPVTEIWTS